MKINLREIFLVLLIFGLALGWFVHVRRLSSYLQLYEADLVNQHRQANFYFELLLKDGYKFRTETGREISVTPPGAATDWTIDVPWADYERMRSGDFRRGRQESIIHGVSN